jgi:ABC-type glutathione transport system ATPase component
MVPQAAMNSLTQSSKWAIRSLKPAMVHLGLGKAAAISLVHKMFQHVGVPLDFVERYPFELSGGMRQRVALAMALGYHRRPSLSWMNPPLPSTCSRKPTS